jgi:hypothetical protein
MTASEDGAAAEIAARQARSDWLDDVMEELLSRGVARDDIAVHFCAGHRLVVMLKGGLRIEYPAKPDGGAA